MSFWEDLLGVVVGVVTGGAAFFIFALPLVAAVAIGVGAAAITSILAPQAPKIEKPKPLANQATPRTNPGNFIPVVMGSGIVTGIEVHTESVTSRKVQSAQAICIKPNSGTYTFKNIWVGENNLTFTNTPIGAGGPVISATDASNRVVTDFTNYMTFDLHPTPDYILLYTAYASTWFPTWGSRDTFIFTKDVSALVEVTATTKLAPPQVFSSTKYQVVHTSSLPGYWTKILLTDPRFGVGLNAQLIDQSSLDSWDTACAEEVDYLEYVYNADGSVYMIDTLQGPRFGVNGALDTGAGVTQMLTEIGNATNCVIKHISNSGKIGIVPNKASTTVVVDLDETNVLKAEVQAVKEKPISQVQVTYLKQDLIRNTTSPYDLSTIPYTAIPSTAIAKIAAPANSNEVPKNQNVTANLIGYAHQARRLAEQTLRLGQRTLGISIIGDHTLLGLEAGDLVTYTNSLFGYDKKKFIVQDIRGNLTQDKGLSFEITLKEYGEGDYIDEVTVNENQSDFPPPTPTPGVRFDYSRVLPAPTLYNSQFINDGSIAVLATVPSTLSDNSRVVANKVNWRYFTKAYLNTDFRTFLTVPNTWVQSFPSYITFNNTTGMVMAPPVSASTQQTITNNFIVSPDTITLKGLSFTKTSGTNSMSIRYTISGTTNSLIDIAFNPPASGGTTITIHGNSGDVSNVVNIPVNTPTDLTFEYYFNYFNILINGQFIYSVTAPSYFNAINSVSFTQTAGNILKIQGISYNNTNTPNTYNTFASILSTDVDGYYNAGDKLIATLPNLTADTYYVQYQLSGYAGETGWSNALTINYRPQSITFVKQYLFVRFATDSVGTGFSNSYNGASYIGFYNSDLSNDTNITDPRKYIWQPLSSTASSTNKVWFRLSGYRQFSWAVSQSNPNIALWSDINAYN